MHGIECVRDGGMTTTGTGRAVRRGAASERDRKTGRESGRDGTQRSAKESQTQIDLLVSSRLFGSHF